MKKKVLSILLCASMAAALLFGCGSEPADNDAEVPASANGGDTAELPAASGEEEAGSSAG